MYFADLENREKSSDNTRSNSLLSFLRNNNLTAGQGQGALPHSGMYDIIRVIFYHLFAIIEL